MRVCGLLPFGAKLVSISSTALGTDPGLPLLPHLHLMRWKHLLGKLLFGEVQRYTRWQS